MLLAGKCFYVRKLLQAVRYPVQGVAYLKLSVGLAHFGELDMSFFIYL